MRFKDRKASKPNRYKATPEGSDPFYVVLERADEPTEEGTPLNAAVLNAMTSASGLSPAMLDDGSGETGGDNSIDDNYDTDSALYAVRYTKQTLTAAQKAQARANIGAAAVGEGGGGSSATVTKDSIEIALGYTPADDADVKDLSQRYDENEAEVAALRATVSGVSDLVNDFNSDISQLYNDVAALHKTENYIFTGSYTNVQGQYQVALDDNYSWDNLVGAVRGGRYVACVLFDEDKLLPLIFTAGEVFVEDGYVNLHSDGEGTVRRELYIYENGDLELYETSLATRAEIAGKLDTYTFTGVYNSDAYHPYPVTLDDNYSWDKLLAAIDASKDVRCVLTDGKSRILLTFASYSLTNGTVMLTSADAYQFKWTFVIRETNSHVLHSFVAAPYDKLAGKLDAYTFTGEYTHNDDDTYTVTLDDNYSWDKLVSAIKADKYVACTLWDEEELTPICLTLGFAWLDDGFVVFNTLDEDGIVFDMHVHSDVDPTLRFYTLATKKYVTNAIENSTPDIVAEVLAALPTWEGGSY